MGCEIFYGDRAPDGVHAAPPVLVLPPLDLGERARPERCATSPIDDIEAYPGSALLLLAHYTNLGSFPALQRLNDPSRGGKLAVVTVIKDCME